MLSVLLLILKIIGIILLCIVGLVLLVILAVLFAPIRYKITAEAKKPDIKARGKARWLLFVLTVTADYKDYSVDTVIRVFGIPIKKFSKQIKDPDDDSGPDDRNIFEKILDKVLPITPELDEETMKVINGEQEESKELQFEPIVSRRVYEEDAEILELDGVIYQEDEEDEPESTIDVLDEIFDEYEQKQRQAQLEKTAETARREETNQEETEESQEAPPEKKTLKEGVSTAKDKALGLKEKVNKALDFIEDEENIKAYELIKEKLLLLARHYKPRKIKGEMEFGLDDPATTGRIIGTYYILFPPPNKNFKLVGNFKEEYYEGNIFIRGHIRLNHLLLAAWRLYRNERIRSFINKED